MIYHFPPLHAMRTQITGFFKYINYKIKNTKLSLGMILIIFHINIHMVTQAVRN